MLHDPGLELKDASHLAVKILLFAPLLLLVLAANLFLDPAGVLRKAADRQGMYEYRIAHSLASGSNVTLARPIDDRLIQKYFIGDLTAAPDIAVLGSSDSVWLGKNVFPDKDIINNSVSDAALADYLGIFEGYAQKNSYPQRVIIFLNPQLILPTLVSDRWVSIKDDVYRMLQNLGVHSQRIKEPMIPQAWQYIFSFGYFQDSMQELRDRFRPSSHLAGRDLPGGQLMFLSDGRCLMEFNYKDGQDSRRKTIKGIYHGQLAQVLRNPMEPDKELESILESFIRYLTSRHIQVTLCLTPCHPQRYQSLLELRKKAGLMDIIGIERYYRDLARRLNIKITGSYDPAVSRLEDDDFYDGEHIRNDVVEKLFKQEL